MTTDVLIIGAGLAGFCASLEALAAGCTVTLLEKQPTVGGSTVLSGGAMAFAGTPQQEQAGIADSDEQLRDDLLRVGEHWNDPALVDAYVMAQRETYDWLRDQGVRFTSVQLGGGQSLPRSNRVDTQQMIGALERRAKDSTRFTLLLGSPARYLLRDDGRIVGAMLHDGAEMRARRGVVLASGGFSRDDGLLALFAPAQRDALRIGGAGNTGDGLRMACAMGAGLADIGFIRGTFGTHPDAGPEQLSIIHAIYKGAIAVNRDGRRFIDESVSYKIIGDACLRQPGGLAFQIFDQSIMDLSVSGVATSDMQAGLADGRVVAADTLEALATGIGIDADRLRATVETYNADVATGRDNLFGRDGLAGHYGALRRIETPPFYAFASTSAVLATYGGLSVDPAMQVRDVFGEPIPGLFAAGEVTGGLHGAAYMTGSSLGKSAIFGRVAGRSAANLLNGKKTTMRDLSRRGLAAVAAFAAAFGQARAQGAFPGETIKLIVPFPPGGPTDLVARAMAQEMRADWGQPVVVENRAGGNGIPAAEAVARARPDGHTLFMPFFGTLVVNPALYATLPYDPVKDFAPITTIATLPLMLVVHPASPFRTLGDVIAEAKRRPGAVTYASGGVGQGAHLAGALLARMADISLTHVPYRGNAPAVADVIGGHVAMIFDGMATSLPHVREGRLRAIVISTARRASAVPDLPTVAESGLPGFDVGSWFGLLAPAGTPATVIATINGKVREIMQRDAFRKLLADSGLEPTPKTPDEFAAMMVVETRRWSDLVRETGIRVE